MARAAFDKDSEDGGAGRRSSDGDERRLMCQAHGCPNRWSSDTGPKLCRWHAASDKHHWPSITQEQQDAETERAMANSNRDRSEPAPPVMLSHSEKMAILARLRGMFTVRQDPRAWVAALQKRHDAGEKLSLFQVDCLRRAQGTPAGLNEPGLDDRDLHRAKQEAAWKVEQYKRDNPPGY